MRPEALTLESLPAWAKLNNVVLDGVSIVPLPRRGSALVASRNLASKSPGSSQPPCVMTIPSSLFLSPETVVEYCCAASHLRDLLAMPGIEVSISDHGAVRT
jgi:hypothetical protein